MDATTMFGLGAMIAGLMAIIKAAAPEIKPQYVRLIVLAVTVVVVIVGAVSGEVATSSPYGLLAIIVNQAVVAMGIREGVVGVIPRAASGPGING